jgi:acyl carrier protein
VNPDDTVSPDDTVRSQLAQLIQWVATRHPDAHVGPDDDLIDSRIIDSLAFTELLILIERLSGRPIDLESLNIEDFRTINRIGGAFFGAKSQ